MAGVFLLRHGKVDRVNRLPYREAIKELFVRLIQVRVSADEVIQSHSVLEEILAAVPSYEFTFRPTGAAFENAQRAVDVQARW